MGKHVANWVPKFPSRSFKRQSRHSDPVLTMRTLEGEREAYREHYGEDNMYQWPTAWREFVYNA